MDNGKAARLHLLTCNTEKVEQVFLHAKERAIPDPVVLVLDLGDELAGVIGVNTIGQEKRDTMLVEAAKMSVVPIAIVYMAYTEALRVFGGIHAGTEAPLRKGLPPGYFWVIAMAEGGRSYAGLPIPA